VRIKQAKSDVEMNVMAIFPSSADFSRAAREERSGIR
jgi:hypothetical protein